MIGSLEEVMIVTSKISLGDKSIKIASLRKARRVVCISIARMVEIVPKNIIVRKCWKN